ncbi:hypothetical protein HMPREF0063_11475 [Aeromicrobium marinum DSM 15272]|uniref:ThiS family protein n=1 Tax=Aeromicrobium marinum DSM 15272 TaxID=585531 RepID=E2SBR6_9ACTN|nr:MoaD/ThiS family protein [Aeromicrobium marinum]EFQ83202.1 hypothetical protein HMPREF0063_11475 [Aeromicrobium marinum DSM 15272]
MTVVTCRYWGGAKAAAGTESELVAATTLAGVMAEITRRRPADRRFSDVVDACSVLVEGVAVGSRDPASVQLRTRTTVEFLPPFAGG